MPGARARLHGAKKGGARGRARSRQPPHRRPGPPRRGPPSPRRLAGDRISHPRGPRADRRDHQGLPSGKSRSLRQPHRGPSPPRLPHLRRGRRHHRRAPRFAPGTRHFVLRLRGQGPQGAATREVPTLTSSGGTVMRSIRNAMLHAVGLLWAAGAGAKPPLGLPDVPIPGDNPPTPEKIAPGEKLFKDKRFSRTGEVACANCHDEKKAFTDSPLQVSEGIKKLTGTRNAPTVVNAAYMEKMFTAVGALRV